MAWRTTANGLISSNVPLQSLIADAFSIRWNLVSGGPAWVYSKGFDISAKVIPPDTAQPIKLTDAQQSAMLRSLLQDRFHLKAHVESKILPIYELVVAKDGPRMRGSSPLQPSSESSSDSGPEDPARTGTMTFRPGHLEAHRYGMAAFASQLGAIIQSNVLDETGLAIQYDFTLDWAPEDRLQAPGSQPDAGTDAHPPIFTAIQEQLGLKLILTKGSVDTLVIDHIDLPTEN